MASIFENCPCLVIGIAIWCLTQYVVFIAYQRFVRTPYS